MNQAPWLPYRSASRGAVGAGFIAAAVGMAVLLGWSLDLERLTRVVPAWSSMKPNTALCLVLSGLALVLAVWGRRPHWPRAGLCRRLAWTLAGSVAALVLANLLEYVPGIDLGIDQLLFDDPHSTTIPGRMSLITAACLLLFAFSVTVPDRRHGPLPMLFQVACTTGLVIAYLAVAGYLLGMRLLLQPVTGTSIAVHTALTLLLLFAGTLVSRPDRGWVQLPMKNSSIGLMTRVLLPVLLLLPLVLGWLVLQSYRMDVFATGGAIAVLVTASALLLGGTVLFVAYRAANLDDRLQAQDRIGSAMMNNSLDAFILMDERGVVQEWNPQAERIFGWSGSEAVGRLLDTLVIPEDSRSAHRSGLARFLESGEGPVILTRTVLNALHRSGNEFTAELVIIPVQVDGRWLFGGYVRDVTEQIATEEQLRQSQKMEAVGQLTGGVAHDLNNLLTVIIGGLEMLGRGDSRAAPGMIGTALQAAERSAALVQRLLAFARRQTLAPERLDVTERVTDMRELMARTLGEAVEIDLAFGPGLWPVFADPGQVENALLNLALNARDAMDGAGKLSIDVNNVHLDQDYAARNEVQAGDYVVLAVSDTGHGMSEEVLRRAVDPFFTTKASGKGSGLGLSMIYGFARQSGGHLKIYSEVDQGTTVRLYLPRAEGGDPGNGARQAAPDPAPRSEGKGERILIVEDDDSVRIFVVTLLENLGYSVSAAANGKDALAILEADQPFELLFTDVVLPGGLSGRQLADAAQQLRPGLKVLFTSGYTENAIVHHGRLDPDVEFIAKPYKTSELAARLRQVIGG